MSSKNEPEAIASRPWSLAVRLTAYYAVSAFLIVAGATSFLYWAMARNVDLEDDRALADKIRLLRSILESAPVDAAALQQEVNESWQAGQDTIVFIRVIAADGTIIAESPDMQTLLPPELFTAPAHGPQRGRSVQSRSDRAYRLMSAKAGGTAMVQVAVDRTQEQDLLVRYEEGLWYALGAALLICALSGFAIARRGLRPIREISATASAIRPKNLSQRIPLSGLPEEMHQLATSFNGMLDRLESAFERLSRFSADIAHELRTPLNNLRGGLDVAAEKPRTAEEYAELIGSSLEECGRLERIVDSLLFLARAENAQVQVGGESFDVTTEIENIREFFAAMAQDAGVGLKAQSYGAIWASLNRPLFQRAIGNLVTNSLAHTEPGGVITLSAQHLDSKLTVEVTDTGRGISADNLPHVFERFYRADQSRTPSSGGIGLGLAIVKSIVELHQDTVDVSSEIGEGTRVRLSFPMQPPQMTKS